MSRSHSLTSITRSTSNSCDNNNSHDNPGHHDNHDNRDNHGNHVAEQCGRHVLQELLTSEQIYCEALEYGIARYTRIFQLESELPDGLLGQQHVLLSNVAQIAALHRHRMLPLMLQHRQQLQVLFERWLGLIERGFFDCYVFFTASQRDSLRLYESHEMYFKRLQITLGDPLGIGSFLLRPVQRMTKYPLLLHKLIETFYANRQLISKQLFEASCRLEKRLRELIDRANQSDQLNDIKHFNAFSVLSNANFVMVGEFQLHDARLRRSYPSKLFAFNTCLIYTERKGAKQLLRGNFMLPDVCFVAKTKSFVLCNKQRECEFVCPQPAVLDKWQMIVQQLLGQSADYKPDEEQAVGVKIEEIEECDETTATVERKSTAAVRRKVRAIAAATRLKTQHSRQTTTWYTT